MIYFNADYLLISNIDVEYENNVAVSDGLKRFGHIYSRGRIPKSGEIITYSSKIYKRFLDTGIFLCLDTQEKVDALNDHSLKLGDNIIISEYGRIDDKLDDFLDAWTPAVKTEEEARRILEWCFDLAMWDNDVIYEDQDMRDYASSCTIKPLKSVELFDTEDEEEDAIILEAFPEIYALQISADAEKKESTLCFDSCSPDIFIPKIREILEKILKKIPECCHIHISDKRRFFPVLNFNDLSSANLITPSKWPRGIGMRLKPALFEIFILNRLWKDAFAEDPQS